MATLYKAGGEVLEIRPENGSDCFQLEELQKIIGGYVETVRHPYASENQCMLLLVDEEGRLKRLPRNVKASKMTGKLLVGNVLHLTVAEWKATME